MRYKIDRNHKITRFLCLLLGMILLTGSMCIPGYAAEYWPEGPEVVSPNVIVMEASTGTVLYDCDSLEAHYPASITKIMTLILIFDALDKGSLKMDDTVTTSAHAKSMGGSQVFLEEGEIQTVETLIKCIVIASGNDASVAMASQICGSEQE